MLLFFSSPRLLYAYFYCTDFLYDKKLKFNLFQTIADNFCFYFMYFLFIELIELFVLYIYLLVCFKVRIYGTYMQTFIGA